MRGVMPRERDVYGEVSAAVQRLARDAERVVRRGAAHEAEGVLRGVRRLRRELEGLGHSPLIRWLERLEAEVREAVPGFAPAMMTCCRA
jgi:hypothetical protein